MKPAAGLAAIGTLLVLGSVTSTAAEPKKKPTTPPARSTIPIPAQFNLAATRMMLIDRMKASMQQLPNALPVYEKKSAQQSRDCETKKKLSEDSSISRGELENCERGMSNARLELQRVREWIAEDDASLNLAEDTARENLAQLSK